MFRLGLLFLLGFIPPAFGQPANAGLARLQADVERITQAAGGTVGVAVRHIESGREIHLNGGQRLPMASAFKVSVAVQLLTLVERGALSLDKVITLRPGDLRPGGGTLVKTLKESRPEYSVRTLLELMLIHSDNTATDVLLREAGGAEAVTARLRALGIQGISVDRPTSVLIADAWGIPPPPDAEATPDRYRELTRSRTREERAAAKAAFFKDTRDTATPEALVDLALKIWRQEALGAEQTALLLDIMYRCETGGRRLRGLLPKETKIAHKTGSLTIGVTNDFGIITLPNDAGHLAIAVMIRESPHNLQTQERVIAEIARAAYDYFSTAPN